VPSLVRFGLGRLGLPLEAPAVGGVIVCDGDSLTAGFELETGEDYPAVLGVSLGASWTVHNLATIGHSVDQMIAGGSAVDALNPDWVVILGGTNDTASGATAAAVLADLEAYCDDRHAEGASVAICTIPPNGFGVGSVIDTVNTALRNNLATYGERLVDLAADARLQDIDGPNYLGDRLHFSAAGMVIFAELVEAAIT
jgi:lysophospholipase L1-like esterase